MKDSFPADFYVATATVIPVLFLAVAIQSPFIERWRKAIRGSKVRLVKFFTIVQFFALPVLFAGVLGEIAALEALFNQRDDLSGREFVFTAVIILLVAVATVPIYIVLGGPMSDEKNKLQATDDQS
jgi:hypothetical protein